MKYLITATFEMDGHSSAEVMICDGIESRKSYLHALLYNEENKEYYPTSNSIEEEDGSTTMYGHWECGEWAINILPFKAYKDIVHKERFVRTG
jgi:hypothetical protein